MVNSVERTYLLLTLATHAADNLRRANADQRNAQFAANSTRQQRLATAGRSVEQDATRRVDSDVRVDLGVGERVLDELADVLQNSVDSGQIRVEMKDKTT